MRLWRKRKAPCIPTSQLHDKCYDCAFWDWDDIHTMRGPCSIHAKMTHATHRCNQHVDHPHRHWKMLGDREYHVWED